jgi:hypothetical protein
MIADLAPALLVIAAPHTSERDPGHSQYYCSALAQLGPVVPQQCRQLGKRVLFINLAMIALCIRFVLKK